MRALMLLLVTSIGFAQAPQQVTPERRAEAKQHYINGLRKFDVAKFDEAAVEFVAAYEIVGDASILYNIAQSYRLGERHEKALFFYKAFQRHLDPKSPLRGEVEKRIAELTQVIDEAKHATNAPPTGTIKSEHLTGVESTRPETKPRETTKPPETKPPETKPETKPRETAKPETTKPPETAKRPERPRETARMVEPKPEKKPAGPPSPALKYAGIALLGVGVAGLVVGAGMSGAAGKDSQNLEDASKQHVAFGPHLQSSESNGQLYDTLSYVFYGIGAAAAVAGAVTLYFGLRSGSSARAQITPAVGANSAGLQLSGQF